MDTPKIKNKILRYLHKNESAGFLDITPAFSANSMPTENQLAGTCSALQDAGYVRIEEQENSLPKLKITPEGNKYIEEKNKHRNTAIILPIIALVITVLGFTVKDFIPIGGGKTESSSTTQNSASQFSVKATSNRTSTTTAINVVITAVASEPCKQVVLHSQSETEDYGTFPMKTTDSEAWTFTAEFFEAGTYTLTVEATNNDGEVATDSFTIEVSALDLGALADMLP